MPDAPIIQTVELGDTSIKKLAAAFRKVLREELERADPGTQEVEVGGFGASAYLDLVRAIDEAVAGFLPDEEEPDDEGA